MVPEAVAVLARRWAGTASAGVFAFRNQLAKRQTPNGASEVEVREPLLFRKTDRLMHGFHFDIRPNQVELTATTAAPILACSTS
jgi:hypothetical protein